VSLPEASLLEGIADEHAVRAVIYRYCRGVDRRQFELVRSCYHPDAWDDHGFYRGGVEGFIARAQAGLARYERTMHFTGNLYIEFEGEAARSEAYTVAYHRLAADASAPERDYVVGLRYLDRFERRSGEWRISERVCVFDWTRTDPVPPGAGFGADFLRGRADAADPVIQPPARRPAT
jgi:hypothetical protein